MCPLFFIDGHVNSIDKNTSGRTPALERDTVAMVPAKNKDMGR